MLHLSWEHLLVLAIVGVVVFGPDRLPKVAGDAARFLRNVRRMAQNATADLRAELGPEMADLDLTALSPRRFVQKHLFEDEPGGPPVPDVVPQPLAPARLAPGERPPFDPDAT